MSLRTIIESMHGGPAALASARLRRKVLHALDEGMEASGISQAELARRLGRSRSAVSQVLLPLQKLQKPEEDYHQIHPKTMRIWTLRVYAM